MKDIIELIKSNKKYLAAYFMAGVLVYGYYIFSTALYMDDHQRYFSENYGWNHEARFGLTGLYYFITGGPFIDYMGHFMQLGAIFIYSCIALLLVNKLCKKVTYLKMFYASPLILFPFTGTVLWYRYDSIGMAFALLLCILPSLTSTKNSSKKIQLIVSTALYLYALFTYPLALNGAFALVFLLFIEKLKETEKVMTTLTDLALHLLAIVGAMTLFLIFRKIGLFSTGDGWVGQLSAIPANRLEIFGQVYHNLLKYFKSFDLYFGHTIVGSMALLVVASYGVVQIYAIAYKPIQNKALRIMLYIVTFIFIIIAPTLMTLPMKRYITAGRYFYSMSIGFTFMVLILTEYKINVPIFRVFRTLCLSYLVLIMASGTSSTGAAFVYWFDQMNSESKSIVADINSLTDAENRFSMVVLYPNSYAATRTPHGYVVPVNKGSLIPFGFGYKDDGVERLLEKEGKTYDLCSQNNYLLVVFKESLVLPRFFRRWVSNNGGLP